MKVLLLGDLGVGKTSLRAQYIHHVFGNAYKATVGADYLTASVGGTTLQIWDTAGQERFNLLLRAFYRGASVVVLVYDTTSYESVLSLPGWFARFVEHSQAQRPGVLVVGTKTDLAAQRSVDRDEIRHLLTRNSNGVLDRSVDWDSNVFEVLAKLLALVAPVFRRAAELGASESAAPSIDLDAPLRRTPCAC